MPGFQQGEWDWMDKSQQQQMDLISLLAGQLFPGSRKGGRGIANQGFDMLRQLELLHRASQPSNPNSTSAISNYPDIFKLFGGQ